jgi:nitrite reductase (NO-forming)
MNLLGFVALTIIGTMQTMFPTVTAGRLASDRLAVLAFVLLPTGVIALVCGFLLQMPLVQIAAGVVFLLGVSVYGTNVLRTWSAAPNKWSVPVLHMLAGTAWLTMTVIAGILLAWNNRTEPPAFSIGTAHLMSYSHMAFTGFILQTIIGALSHLLPVILALTRVNSQNKRRPYLARLTAQVERWKWIQIGALNLGVLIMAAWGLTVGAFGLTANATSIAKWVATALLFLGLGLFGGKIIFLLRSHPAK